MGEVIYHSTVVTVTLIIYLFDCFFTKKYLTYTTASSVIVGENQRKAGLEPLVTHDSVH